MKKEFDRNCDNDGLYVVVVEEYKERKKEELAVVQKSKEIKEMEKQAVAVEVEVDSRSVSCKANVGNQKEGSWNIMVTECYKKMKKIGN